MLFYNKVLENAILLEKIGNDGLREIAFGFFGGTIWDDADNEVDDGGGKYTDDETNTSIKNGIFGFFEFASIAGGGHVEDTTNNNSNDGDNAENKDNTVDNPLDSIANIVAGSAWAAGGLFDFFGDTFHFTNARFSKSRYGSETSEPEDEGNGGN